MNSIIYILQDCFHAGRRFENGNHPQQTFQEWMDANDIENKVSGLLPIDYVDAEMVKRWYQKVVGNGEEEMKADIKAMVRAYILGEEVKWDNK